MHKEAKEELEVRFKLVVLDFASHIGVRRPAGSSTSRVQLFTVGNRDTRAKDDLGCIEISRSHIAIHARHLLRLLRES